VQNGKTVTYTLLYFAVKEVPVHEKLGEWSVIQDETLWGINVASKTALKA
jgi:hypothetical protein